MAEKQEFEIFTGVAVPAMKHGFASGPRESKYPFDQLDVGDLLVIPETTSKSFGGTVRAAEQRTGYAFTLRSGPVSDDKGNVIVPAGGVGIWRIAEKPARKSVERTPEQKAASLAKGKATRAANQAKKAA
jgi:hypothetical protein